MPLLDRLHSAVHEMFERNHEALSLGYENLIDYYRLRFQIEFNFRDAKQYWGLEDFMSVNERPVYNSANLAMFMFHVLSFGHNLIYAGIGLLRISPFTRRE